MRDDEQRTLKIELLSQWKLEAESCNFSLIYFCVIMALYRFEMGTRSIFSESFSRNQGFLWSSLRNCSIPVALPANPALQRLHFCSWGLSTKLILKKELFFYRLPAIITDKVSIDTVVNSLGWVETVPADDALWSRERTG